MKKHRVLAVILLLILSSLSQLSYTQNVQDFHNFKCFFLEGKTLSFEKEKPTKIKIDDDKISGPTFYQAINHSAHEGITKDSRLYATDVKVFAHEKKINIIEYTSYGDMNLTTIFNHLIDENKYFSVTSRHTTWNEYPFISTCYGYCEGY